MKRKISSLLLALVVVGILVLQVACEVTPTGTPINISQRVATYDDIYFLHDEVHSVGIWWNTSGSIYVLPDSQYTNSTKPIKR